MSWLGCGFLEGDCLAGEAFEFGDELSFAADWGETVVPVGTQVGELGVGVWQQVPGDDQDGVARRDDGTLLAAAAGDPVVPGAEECLRACLRTQAAPVPRQRTFAWPGRDVAHRVRVKIVCGLPGGFLASSYGSSRRT